MDTASKDIGSHLQATQLTRALSARRLEAHAADLFALSMRELQLIQVCVTNVSSLPKTRAELEERAPGTAAVLGPTTDRLLALLRRLDDSAHDWMSERVPVIKSCAEDIARYGSHVEGIYATLRALIRQLAACAPGEDDALRGRILNDVDAQIGRLCGHAREHAASAARTADDSAQWVDRLRRSSKDLRMLSESVQSTVAVRSQELEQINLRIKALNEEIQKLNSSAATHRERAAANSRLVWIPFAGVGFATAALVEATTAKRLAQQANQVMRQLEDARSKDLDGASVYAAIALLQTTSGWIDSVERNLDGVVPVLGHLRGIWDVIATDLSAVPRTLRAVTRCENPRPILMRMGLDAAVLEWRALASKARAFVGDVNLPAEPEVLSSAPHSPVAEQVDA